MKTHVATAPRSTNPDPLMTITEVSAYIGLSEPFVRRTITNGHLECIRFSARAIRVRRSAVESYLAGRTR